MAGQDVDGLAAVELGVRGGGVVAGLDEDIETGDEEGQSRVAQDTGGAAQDLEQPRDVLEPLRPVSRASRRADRASRWRSRSGRGSPRLEARRQLPMGIDRRQQPLGAAAAGPERRPGWVIESFAQRCLEWHVAA